MICLCKKIQTKHRTCFTQKIPSTVQLDTNVKIVENITQPKKDCHTTKKQFLQRKWRGKPRENLKKAIFLLKQATFWQRYFEDESTGTSRLKICAWLECKYEYEHMNMNLYCLWDMSDLQTLLQVLSTLKKSDYRLKLMYRRTSWIFSKFVGPRRTSVQKTNPSCVFLEGFSRYFKKISLCKNCPYWEFFQSYFSLFLQWLSRLNAQSYEF